ncbi:hypothetical protein ACTFIY_001251 [Dictyostelium cf. discoideum]
MPEHEKVSYEIRGSGNSGEYFLITIKDDFLYCNPRSKEISTKRTEVRGSKFLKIDNKLFEIKYLDLNRKLNLNFNVFEIDYFEPTETFQKFPLTSSFCIGNIPTDDLFGSFCLFFIYHEHLQFINNKAN